MFFNLRAYQGAAMLPLLLFYQHLLQYEEKEGGNAPPPHVFFSAVLAATGRRLGVPRWPPLCLCTPFPALHSSARNHETM